MKMFDFRQNTDIAAAVNFDHVIDTLNEKRDADCNKGTFGTLCCVCGSYGMAGAAMLCGSAAVTTGAGIVKMVIPESIYSICAANLWENVFVPLPVSDGGTLRADRAEGSPRNPAPAPGPGQAIHEHAPRVPAGCAPD